MNTRIEKKEKKTTHSFMSQQSNLYFICSATLEKYKQKKTKELK